MNSPASDEHAPAPGEDADDSSIDAELPCVMCFNAGDPSGAAGLSADIASIVSVGGHPLPVTCGAYARDTADVFGHYAFDDEAITEQARALLEDVPVRVFKAGFLGTPEAVAAVAEIATDYDEVPLVTYMPNLSWWDEAQIDLYLDAISELLLPQTTVLVGNHNTLWRWLLPDWSSDRSPSARDIAAAAAKAGVSYVVVTGIALPDQYIDNALATPQAVLASRKFERFEAVFSGAGETYSAALAALLANGVSLEEAFNEALEYLDHCLDNGFRPGMGHVLPDRLFWAQPDPAEDAQALSDDDMQALQVLDMPAHDTKH